ncbi:hypothetical protein HDV05_007714 [Chytridiales sp. JEL 0842]|nr:hypothetical protein HDV05_007714 [Chytridiales sp. JEL 0842]
MAGEEQQQLTRRSSRRIESTSRTEFQSSPADVNMSSCLSPPMTQQPLSKRIGRQRKASTVPSSSISAVSSRSRSRKASAPSSTLNGASDIEEDRHRRGYDAEDVEEDQLLSASTSRAKTTRGGRKLVKTPTSVAASACTSSAPTPQSNIKMKTGSEDMPAVSKRPRSRKTNAKKAESGSTSPSSSFTTVSQASSRCSSATLLENGGSAISSTPASPRHRRTPASLGDISKSVTMSPYSLRKYAHQQQQQQQPTTISSSAAGSSSTTISSTSSSGRSTPVESNVNIKRKRDVAVNQAHADENDQDKMDHTSTNHLDGDGDDIYETARQRRRMEGTTPCKEQLMMIEVQNIQNIQPTLTFVTDKSGNKLSSHSPTTVQIKGRSGSKCTSPVPAPATAFAQAPSPLIVTSKPKSRLNSKSSSHADSPPSALSSPKISQPTIPQCQTQKAKVPVATIQVNPLKPVAVRAATAGVVTSATTKSTSTIIAAEPPSLIPSTKLGEANRKAFGSPAAPRPLPGFSGSSAFMKFRTPVKSVGSLSDNEEEFWQSPTVKMATSALKSASKHAIAGAAGISAFKKARDQRHTATYSDDSDSAEDEEVVVRPLRRPLFASSASARPIQMPPRESRNPFESADGGQTLAKSASTSSSSSTRPWWLLSSPNVFAKQNPTITSNIRVAPLYEKPTGLALNARSTRTTVQAHKTNLKPSSTKLLGLQKGSDSSVKSSPNSTMKIQRLVDQLDSHMLNSPRKVAPRGSMDPLGYTVESAKKNSMVGGMVGAPMKWSAAFYEDEEETDSAMGLFSSSSSDDEREAIRGGDTAPLIADKKSLANLSRSKSTAARLPGSVLKRIFQFVMDDNGAETGWFSNFPPNMAGIGLGGPTQVHILMFVCFRWSKVAEGVLWAAPRFLSLNQMRKMNAVVSSKTAPEMSSSATLLKSFTTSARSESLAETSAVATASSGLRGMLGIPLEPKTLKKDPRKFLFGDPCNEDDEIPAHNTQGAPFGHASKMEETPCNPQLTRHVQSISYNFFNPADRKHPPRFDVQSFLTDNFKNLTSLSLSGSPDWIDSFLLARIASAKHLRNNLTSLELIGTHKASRDVLGAAGIARLNGLKRIVVENIQALEDSCLAAWAEGCENLETVILKRCDHVTDAGIGRLLQRCTELRVLEISGCPLVKGNQLSSFLTKRQTIVNEGTAAPAVRADSPFTQKMRGPTTATAAVGRKMKSLEQLSLGDFNFTLTEQMLVECLGNPLYSPSLHTLHLRNIKSLTMEALQMIMQRQRSSLRHISIKTCPGLPLAHQHWKEILEQMGPQLKSVEIWLQPMGQHAMSYVDVQALMGIVKARGCLADIVLC